MATNPVRVMSFTLEGNSPYSSSAVLQSVKPRGEGHDAFDERVWRERATLNSEGHWVVPAMALKLMLEEAFRHSGAKVPGRGNKTYASLAKSGLLSLEDFPILGPDGEPITPDKMAKDRRFVPADGKKGGGTRVFRSWPIVHPWTLHGALWVVDQSLEEDIMEEHLGRAGLFVGLGRFRPQNGGNYGRFKVLQVEWSTPE